MKKLFALCMMTACAALCAIGLAGCGNCEHANIGNGKVVSTTATCTKAGTEMVECPSCGETVERSVAAYGHRYQAIDKTGKSFSGKGENYHCSGCHEPLIVLSTKETLPKDVTMTVNANNDTKITAKIKVKSVTLSVRSDDVATLLFTCEKSEGSSANAYLGFKLKITDKNDATRVIDTTVRYSFGSTNRPQEMQIKTGDEFELFSNFSISRNDTNFSTGGWGDYLYNQTQAELQWELSDLTISVDEI